MAGRGPVPKDPSKLGGHTKPRDLRVLPAALADQVKLPDSMPTPDGPAPWPKETRAWWAMWSETPLAADFTAADWSFLLDTALIHGRLWSGDTKAAAELRLRVDQFGMTPTSRARLRITFAQADEADDRRGKTPPAGARQRYDGLKLAE